MLGGLLGSLSACRGEVAECDRTQCDLQLSPGDGRQVMGDADLTVHDVTVRERTADSAVVTVDGDRRELTSGTTQQIGGLKVTLVSVDHHRVHLLVTSAAG